MSAILRAMKTLVSLLICVAGLIVFIAHASARAPIQETLQYIPFNYQNDTRQLKTMAELQTEAQVWIDMVSAGSYGTHQLTVHVWPYVTIGINRPTDQSQCTMNLGFAADGAARAAGYAIGQQGATNYLFYRTPLDNNGEVCSHHNTLTGSYGVTLFQYAEAEGWIGQVKGLFCCSWTYRASNAAGTAFVTLRDYPNPAIYMTSNDQRDYRLWTGQGHGSWTARARLQIGYLTDANFYHVHGPITGQRVTYSLVPMDDQLTNTTAKRSIELIDMGMYCEARIKPESIDVDAGLLCFDTVKNQELDMPPLPPWNGGQIPGATSVVWSLGVGASYVDPTNQQRLTLVSLDHNTAVIALDHSTDAAPCQPTPEGQVVTTLVDSSCATWSLGLQDKNWPAGNFDLVRTPFGLSTASPITGIGRYYESCAGSVYVFGADAVWYNWNGNDWTRLQPQQPCGTPAPPPPPPVKTWHNYTGSAQIQQLDSDPTTFRVCKSDLTSCVEFTWIQ